MKSPHMRLITKKATPLNNQLQEKSSQNAEQGNSLSLQSMQALLETSTE